MSALRSAAFAATVRATKFYDFSDIPEASTDRRTRLAPGLGIVAPSPETSYRNVIAEITKGDRGDHNKKNVLDSLSLPRPEDRKNVLRRLEPLAASPD
jgi:hypothetical protein